MGEVYQAHDTKLGRDVAIKVLPEAFARDPERLSRFQREAKMLAALNHPNIATIYGLEQSSGTSYLVMELVPGDTLADRIKRDGAIPVEEALAIAKQIAEALEAAHEKGIIHRDLKPANVKVTPEGKVKVLDFGLAKAFEGDASTDDIRNSPTLSHAATMQGVILGTAAYMSPEQARGKAVDKRTDIWAFGAVLYELATGKPAFHGEDVTEILASVVKSEPDWSLLPRETPMRLRVLLQRCLQKDPKQRLRDIGDARISLDEVLSGAAEPAPAVATATFAPMWRRVLPWAVAGVLAAALAAVSSIHFREAPVVPEPIRFEMPLPPKSAVSLVGTSFELSPDGRQLAFVAAGPNESQRRLWIRSLGSFDARPLPGTEMLAVGPPFFWSPDSKYIVFDGGGKLKKVNISSDAVEALCDLTSVAVGGSWNREGVIIFGQASGGIMRVSANGGSAAPLTALDSSREENQHMLPSFLPDGRHFIYNRYSNKPGNGGVYIGDIDATPDKQESKRFLAAEYNAAYVPSSGPGMGQLLFMRDDTLMAQPFDANRFELVGEPASVAERVGSFRRAGFFSASDNGVLVYRSGGDIGGTPLTWLDRQGKPVGGTAGETGDYRDPALSPDGKQVVLTRVDSRNANVALWLVDFSRGTNTKFTFGTANYRSPIWSADGNRIVYASQSGGAFDLYQKSANGATGEELLLKTNETKFPTSLSRDGRFLLYSARSALGPAAKFVLSVLPLEGDRKPFVFLGGDFNRTDGHFSPDGHWVVYSSDESGRSEIYVRRFTSDSASAASDTGGKWQVSYGGGAQPQWSADGKQLYYLTLDWKVMSADVSTDPDFHAGSAQFLFQAPAQIRVTEGDYTVDGKRFLFVAPPEQPTETPFTVVLNWQAGMKK
jgi:Tol biopolymer transport system component